VSALPVETISLAGYQLRLPVFEGPLDLLLRLIERNQLAITDVSLVAVTGQFLSHVAALDCAAPETIAEFASVGSRLVLLKSRSLLPRPPGADDEETSDDLVHQLIEYRAVKQAALDLGQRDLLGNGAFTRGTGAVVLPVSPDPPKLALHQPLSLARAVRRRLSILPSPRDVLAARPRIPMREMVERLLAAIPARGRVPFGLILRRCNGRHEMATAFLALLVLVRRHAIEASQESLFGEIQIERDGTDERSDVRLFTANAADD